MDETVDISFHDQVKRQILRVCNALGLQAKEEYRGHGWRADVLVIANDKKFAFEVQITQQTLLRTLERQEKYKKENMIGCWLFQKEPARQKDERADLPMFKIENLEGHVHISLKKRKMLPLNVFISDFLQDRIKFCQTLNPLPIVDIFFVEMPCWKCDAENYIYYIGPLRSACNTEIHYQEAMWVSEKLVFHPEITKSVEEYVASERGRHLKIGEIKERYSKTTDSSYLSFGCWKCDSIFGDWFVHEAIVGASYDDGIDKLSFHVGFDLNLRQKIPHWCHPGNNEFCERND